MRRQAYGKGRLIFIVYVSTQNERACSESGAARLYFAINCYVITYHFTMMWKLKRCIACGFTAREAGQIIKKAANVCRGSVGLYSGRELLNAEDTRGVSGANGAHHVALGNDDQVARNQVAFITQEIDRIVRGGDAFACAVKVNRGHAAIE